MPTNSMAKKKNDFDDPYWESSHTGFDFGGNDFSNTGGDTKLSSVLRNDELNQLDLLRCDGLAEVVENRSSKEFIPFNLSKAENEKYASQLAKNFNPLIINQKRGLENKRYGPEDTVKNMILGLGYSLHDYKGKRQKSELLNAAVRSHDGNAILEIVLYMRDTLKKSIFQREIIQHPDALNVYLAYLEEDHETDELANLHLLMNNAEDAAISKYEAAILVEHPDRKLKWIENLLSTYFQIGVTDIFLRQSLEEHKQLLQEQVELEKFQILHSPEQNEENMLQFENLTGKKSVIDSSVLCSLTFSCLYCYNLSQVHLNFACPEKIKSNYNLSKKQYVWTALRALAAAKRWNDIDDLFISKNWLGGTKVRSCIAFSRILEVLCKAKAPIEVLKKYVSCVENEDEKLMLAKKYACHSVVIEVYKNNKDRIALSNYKDTLSPHTVDFCTATDLLNSSMIRWKN